MCSHCPWHVVSQTTFLYLAWLNSLLYYFPDTRVQIFFPSALPLVTGQRTLYPDARLEFRPSITSNITQIQILQTPTRNSNKNENPFLFSSSFLLWFGWAPKQGLPCFGVAVWRAPVMVTASGGAAMVRLAPLVLLLSPLSFFLPLSSPFLPTEKQGLGIWGLLM